MATTFKIGQIVTANQDIKVEKALSGDVATIKKGSKAIIGADNFAHHLSTDMIQPISKAVKIEGYGRTCWVSVRLSEVPVSA